LRKPTQPNWEHGEISAFINVEWDEYITTLNKVDPQYQFKIMVTK